MDKFKEIIFGVLVLPFAMIYAGITSFRLFLYRMRIIRSSQFDIPVITVGNLTMGGSGKTPHVEYLIRLLQPYINVAILSRGYKRKTSGFRFVQTNDNVKTVGDEPLLYKLKYNDIPVAVGENRALAIPQMLSGDSDINTILLDDAYQHIGVKPYINILLTEYEKPFYKDYIFPIGRLRELRNGYKRADIIIVSKCPSDLTVEQRDEFISKINPMSHQMIFFSYIQYGNPYLFANTSKRLVLDEKLEVLMLTAIANENYMFDYLKNKVKNVKSLAFRDHYDFTNFDIGQAESIYNNINSDQKVLITTEKDTTRLLAHRNYILEKNLPLYILPIEVKFYDDSFDHYIKSKLLEFKV
jgi:tetraacyldisaccharide 4'-kinase